MSGRQSHPRVRRARTPFATGTPAAGGERVGRCFAFHPGAGRCVHVMGHYRSRHDPAPSPHRAADGTEWYGVALRATSPGAASAPMGLGPLGAGERDKREAFTANASRVGRRAR